MSLFWPGSQPLPSLEERRGLRCSEPHSGGGDAPRGRDARTVVRQEATRNKKLLGAPGIATRNKDATSGSWPYY